ncbi:MAG: metallophosphoesterase [Thermodesulfobacteriota bacterium]
MTQQTQTRRLFLEKTFKGLALLAMGYPFAIERSALRTNHYRLPVPNLPPAAQGLTIVHLTDLHCGGPFMPAAYAGSLVRKANAIGGDLIVCTGDFVNIDTADEDIVRVWKALGGLRARLGSYFVLGNHDHWANHQMSLDLLAASGGNLRHRALRIDFGGDAIWLGGAGDLYEDAPGVNQAFRNTPQGECRILLAHNPDIVDFLGAERVDAVLAGHTHGGQVALPLIGAPFLPVRNKRFAQGVAQQGRTTVYVSRGIGCTTLPARLNCPPEISVLHLAQA